MGIWLHSVSVHVLYCPKKGEVRAILLCASLFESYVISEKLSQLKEEGFYNKDNSSAYDFALSLCGYNTKVHTNGQDRHQNLIDHCPRVCEAGLHWGWAVCVCEMVANAGE